MWWIGKCPNFEHLRTFFDETPNKDGSSNPKHSRAFLAVISILQRHKVKTNRVSKDVKFFDELGSE